jgi:DNA-binding LacI/PurR family transcriptional regulator
MRKTIEEIAKIAGVSKTTISRVINNKPDVHPKTRESILKIMDEYEFQPNIFARSIRTQKINHIGLIIPYTVEYIFSNQFYVDVLRGISNEIERRGYYLVICYVHETNYVEIYNQNRVEGFVLMSPGSIHHSIIHELQSLNIPFITTAKLINEPDMKYVDVDNVKSAKMAVEHLISFGHKDIAFIGKPALTSSYDRLIGYKETLKEKDIPIHETLIKVTKASSVQSGYDVMLELLELEAPPTAVFVANDIMAFGAIKAIQEKGKSVPEDISVIGFDDIPLAQHMTPSLTTIRQPAVEKGTIATEILIDFLVEKKPMKTMILETELIKRNSTGPARG